MQKLHNVSSEGTYDENKMKKFIKYFITTFCVSTIIFILIFSTVESAAKIQIFGETETNLMEEMPLLVDKESRFFEVFQEKSRINVLLMGLNDNLADTIMVASFDYDAKHVDIISIPRDTYYYRDKCDNFAAFKINSIYNNTKQPLETAMVVSELLLGMPLHYYAIVDYKGIEKIVDEMGGVPMNIPFRMKYTDIADKPPLYIDIPKGYQTLDGEHSVQFLRYRSGYIEGDIGRIKAQQEFMKSAFKQMLGFDLPKISKVIFQNIDSDITLNAVVKIATKGIGMKSNNIETYIMPHTLQEGAPYYVYPDSEGIADIITDIYSIEPEVDAE